MSENEKKAQEMVKSAIAERNAKETAKNGGKTQMDRWVDLFKKVEEQSFTIKKLEKDEIVMGSIVEAQIKNSVLYPDNYQMMIKAITVYRTNPYTDVEVDISEMVVQEKREIIFLAKAGCTSILRKLKVPEPDGGYDLEALSEDKDVLKPLKNRKFSIKYCGKQEYEGKSFQSYVVQLF